MSGSGRSASRQGIQSVEVASRLLLALADARGPVTLAELSKVAGMHSAKAYRYLVSLCRGGLVEQNSQTGRYLVGPLALRLGLAGLARLDPIEATYPVIESLNAELGETVALAVWGNHGPTIIRWLESAHTVAVTIRTGGVMPILGSATGLAFAAFLPDTVTGPLVRQALGRARRGAPGPASRKELDAVLAGIREERMARVTGWMVPGVTGLSAPVFDHREQMVAAIVIVGLSGRFDDRPDGAIAHALKRGARIASERLGSSATRPGPAPP